MQTMRLQNPHQVRRLLNRTINMLLNEEIETRCIGYLASILLKSMEVEDLEGRIRSLEEDNYKHSTGA